MLRIQSSRVYQVNTSVDSKVENAYVRGFMGTQQIVFYDTLLQNMNQEEMLFVMGHEMGHYVLWHRPKRVAFKSILIMFSRRGEGLKRLILIGFLRRNMPDLSPHNPPLRLGGIHPPEELPLVSQ